MRDPGEIHREEDEHHRFEGSEAAHGERHRHLMDGESGNRRRAAEDGDARPFLRLRAERVEEAALRSGVEAIELLLRHLDPGLLRHPRAGPRISRRGRRPAGKARQAVHRYVQISTGRLSSNDRTQRSSISSAGPGSSLKTTRQPPSSGLSSTTTSLSVPALAQMSAFGIVLGRSAPWSGIT